MLLPTLKNHIYMWNENPIWCVNLLCKQHQSNQPLHDFTNDETTSCVKTNSDIE